jgi:hypothetical protein
LSELARGLFGRDGVGSFIRDYPTLPRHTWRRQSANNVHQVTGDTAAPRAVIRAAFGLPASLRKLGPPY